jgi:hypothetical protein
MDVNRGIRNLKVSCSWSIDHLLDDWMHEKWWFKLFTLTVKGGETGQGQPKPPIRRGLNGI